MRTILLVSLAAALSGVMGCGSSDGRRARVSPDARRRRQAARTRQHHAHPVIPAPVKANAGVRADPRTVTDPDSIAAIVSFVNRRASAWKNKRGLRETPRGSMILDFYLGPALVATVVDRGRDISLQGYKVGLIQKLPRQEKATLAALVGMPADR